MYCSCMAPKLITNTAHGEDFQVCASSLGGCGQEYRTDIPKLPEIIETVKTPVEMRECTECEGSGYIQVPYPYGYVTSECEFCYGSGKIKV